MQNQLLKDVVSYKWKRHTTTQYVKRKKIQKEIMKDNYKLIPMALKEFGECFQLDVPKEIMPYNIYTYENVDMGACSIQYALCT